MNRLIDKNRYGSAQSTLDSPRGVPKLMAAFVFLAAVLGLASPAQAATFNNTDSDSLKNIVIVKEFNTPNGAIDPGETNTVRFSFKLKDGDLNNVKVKLTAPTDKLTFITPGEIELGNIAKDATRTAEFTFVAFGKCGTFVIPQLSFTADGGFTQTLSYPTTSGEGFRLGLVTQFPHNFGPGPGINIKDASKADPYGSTIKVEGITFSDDYDIEEKIERVEVTLTGLTHGYTPDLDVLLVGPNGIGNVVLMSDAGDGRVDNVNLTFRADASNFIPFSTPIASGSFKDKDYDPANNEFPDFTGPFKILSNYKKGRNDATISPNGDWKLFIMDDQQIDAGSLASWSLNIVTRKVVCSGGGFPTITPIDKIETNEDPDPNNPPTTIEFTINDAEESGDLSKLTVTAESSIPEMFPKGMSVPDPDTAANRVGSLRIFTGSASNKRILRLYPAKDSNGTAIITVKVADPQNHVSQTTFEFKVNAVNDAPTFGEIPNYASNIGTPTPDIPFTIGDVDNTASTLNVQVVSSSDENVAKTTSIIVQGTGANRTVKVVPVSSTTSGQTTITLRVVDPSGASTTGSFAVAFDVTPGYPNVAPIANQTTNEDESKSVTFGVSDDTTPVDQLQFTVTSSDQTLIPNANLVISGSGLTRTLKMTPAAQLSGAATVTVTVRSPLTTRQTVRSFVLTVNPVNDAPIVDIGSPIILNEDSPTGDILFHVYDWEDGSSTSLTMETPEIATSGLISQVIFGGTTRDRTIKIVPVANAFGRTKMKVKAKDFQGAIGEREIDVIINGINDQPTINVPGSNYPVDEDTEVFLTLDGMTPGPSNESQQTLTVTATSGNTAILPNPGVDQLNQTAGTVRLKFKSAENKNGNDIEITVTVTDNGGTANGGVNQLVKKFKVNVVNLNDTPTFTADIANQSAYKDQNKTVAFTLDDKDETADSAANLTVTAEEVNSSGTPTVSGLISGFAITAGGFNRSLTIISAKSGNAGETYVKVTVKDPQNATSSKQFRFTVLNQTANQQPTITSIRYNGNVIDSGDKPLSINEEDVAVVQVYVDDDQDEAQLTMSANSSNTGLLPNSNLISSQTGGAIRDLTVWPLTDKSGQAIVTVTVVDNDAINKLAGSAQFRVVVNDIPDFPVITAKDNVTGATWDEDSSKSIDITATDAETPADQLVFEVETTNADLIPVANVSIPSGGNATRTVTFTPKADQNGSATIRIRVKDTSGLASVLTLNMTVNPVNDRPTIDTSANLVISEDSAEQIVNMTAIFGGPANENRVVTFDNGNKAYSSNAGVIAESNTSITDYDSSAGTAKVRFTPTANKNGTVNLKVVVRDNQDSLQTNSFNVTITEINDAPTITAIANPPAVTETNAVISAGPFTVGDIETAIQNLVTEFVSSSNPALVDAANVFFTGGQAAERGILITPKSGQFGTAVITVRVRDGGNESNGSDVKTTSTSFTIVVNAVDAPPVISAIPDQYTTMGVDTDIINFTVTDRETPANVLAGSVTVTVQSSTPPALVVPGNIFLMKNAAPNYQMIIRPSSGLTGEATILITANDSTNATPTASRAFKLFVRVPQNPPIISAIPNQTVQLNQSATVQFSISDTESPSGFLTLSGASSAQSLIPDANITFTSQGGNLRTARIVPLLNQSGQAIIQIKVTDPDTNSTTATFTVTVLGSGEPTISQIASQTTPEDTAIAVPFTVSDLETTDFSQLLVSAASGNTALVPATGIVVSQTGGNRTITLTPAKDATGSAPIALTVTDTDGKTAVTSFTLTVTPVEDDPTISAIANQQTTTGKSVGPLSFTVSDAETTADNLIVSAASSNTQLVPNSGLVLDGAGANRRLTINPAASGSGSATITVTVRDAADKSASSTFTLTVTATVAKNNSLNADNKADLLFAHTDGTLAVWLMDDVDLVSAQLLSPSNAGPGWHIVASGDMNKDGKMDIFFQHDDGTLAVWYMNSINLVNAELLTPENSGPGWRVVAAADFNQNGAIDLLFQHTDGTLAAWYMNGKSLVSAEYLNPSAPSDVNWRVVGADDLNRDGKTDLVFQQQVTGDLAAWYMNGLSLTSGALLNPANPGAGWKVKVVADYSGDGRPDLIFQNGADLAIWYLDGINLISGEYLPMQTGDANWSVVGPK